MAIGNIRTLRGSQAKQQLFGAYDVYPVIYTRQISGRVRINECGGTLGDKYYQFEAVIKGKSTGSFFYVGEKCGRERLSNLTPPYNSIRFFDPFESVAGEADGDSVESAATPIEDELWSAINLILLHKDTPARGALLDISNALRQSPTAEECEALAQNLNDYLLKVGLAMSSILTSLKQKNPTLREFGFANIIAALSKNGVAEAEIKL